ncbi:MAG: family 10 glycosylhydrolase [Chloroherpetonaceae bacterium]|nr:family 10 glycosylhydrolase [Chthonomonadaceae bacterium]MDW8206736.1 family 10 glycosylhydrolase [Chloroherpetonaceae bacterium]
MLACCSVAQGLRLCLALLVVIPCVFFAPVRSLSLMARRWAPACGSPEGVPAEMRGLWVVRDSLTSPQSIRQVVETARKYHFNALFVQVRGRGDAYYHSPYEPRAEALAGQPPDFDPLRQVIEEAHAHGIAVHAWLNTYLTWSGHRRPASARHLWNAHRDWFACDRRGRCTAVPSARTEGAFLQPSHPGVQEHLFQVFTHVALNYDVDGIHFDYVRYAGADYDYSNAALTRFRAYLLPRLSPQMVAQLDRRRGKDRLAYVHAFPGEWAVWRRQQVTDLVARISAAVRAAKPQVQISAAVFADADDARVARGQEWERWLREGIVDAVALMAYDSRTERVVAQTRRAVQAAGDRGLVFTGIGAWRLQAHDVARKIERVRAAGAAGVNLFSYNRVHARPAYLSTLRRGVFASRAVAPRSRRLPPLPVSSALSAGERPAEGGDAAVPGMP